jgi:enoyl-[acyl-carrier protein] reductase I
MGFMAGKRALIVGVASDRSIATGIAEAFAREGAELAFTYQNDKLKSRVEKLATRLGQNTDLLFPCDVSSDDEIAAVFDNLGKSWDGLDILVHSVGYAPREQLEGGFRIAWLASPKRRFP